MERILRLLKEVKTYWGILIFTVITLTLTSVVSLCISIFTGNLVDMAVVGGDIKDLFIKLIFLMLISIVLGSLDSYIFGCFREKCSYSFKEKTMKKLNKMDIAWVESLRSGDLITRINNDIDTSVAFISQIRDIFSSLFLGLISFIISLYFNWTLALFCVSIPIIIEVYTYYFSKKFSTMMRNRQKGFGEVIAYNQDALNGITDIKSYNLYKKMYSKFSGLVKNYTNIVIKMDSKASLNDALIGFMIFIQNFGVIALGGFLVLLGKITLGEVVFFQLISTYLKIAVKKLHFISLKQNLVSVSRIFEIWDGPEEKIGTINNLDEVKDITFKNLSFNYGERKEKVVLNHINFKFKKGEKVAIVGRSGSGKSTIIKLLCGFYEPTEGEILLNGINIKEINKNALRNKLSLVEQNTFLFPMSIYENIACGKIEDGEITELNNDLNSSHIEKLTLEKVINSGKKASIHDEIKTMDKGYHSELGEGGSKVSGGQGQRISLARAFYRNAEFILMDEPTSALDKDSEDNIMKSIDELIKEKSCILVTHRLNTIKDFHRIIVMKNGEIVEEGTHEELMNLKGEYEKIYGEEKNHEKC